MSDLIVINHGPHRTQIKASPTCCAAFGYAVTDMFCARAVMMGGHRPHLAWDKGRAIDRRSPPYEPRAEAQPRTKTSWSAAAAEAALGLLVLIFRFNTLLNHIPHSTQGHG